MNYSFICVISVFLMITLSHESRGEILRAPFYFYYELQAELNVKLILKNKPADMDFRIHICCITILSHEIVKGRDYFLLTPTLTKPEVNVSIELFSNTRSYKNVTILEGRTEDQSNDKVADQRFKRDDVCLSDNSPCTIELDLGRIFTDSYINTAQSTRNVSVIPITRATETTKLTRLSYSDFESNYTIFPNSGNNVTLSRYGNNATTSTSQREKSVTESPDYGINVTSLHLRNNAITSPQNEKSVITSPDYGNNVTSPYYGNNETTLPQNEKSVTTSPDYGNNVTSRHYGNNETTLPQREKSVTASPDYGNNVTSPHFRNNATTTPPYGNNERSSEQTMNYTNGTGEQTFSQTYIYVIVSVIGIVVLCVTCICIKKYCHRKKQQVKTLELNTYVTANDVIYADLGLAQGDTQPPRRDEESPYAQIIGVMRPDVN